MQGVPMPNIMDLMRRIEDNIRQGVPGFTVIRRMLSSEAAVAP
jgi:hypothetical protein